MRRGVRPVAGVCNGEHLESAPFLRPSWFRLILQGMNRAEVTATAIALAAHVAFIALHRIVPEIDHGAYGEAFVPMEVEIDQEVFETAKKETPLDIQPPPDPDQQQPQDRPREASRPPPVGGRIVNPGKLLTAEGKGKEGGDVVPVPGPSSAPTCVGDGCYGKLVGPLAPPSGVAGIDHHILSYGTGALPAMPAPVPAPTAVAVVAPDRQVANKVLNDAIKDKQGVKTLELPAAGSVASAVRDAVYATGTINEATAVIEVKLGPGGKILSVRVSKMSGGSDADWAPVASAVKAQLAAKTLALGGQYEKGANIQVRVTSKIQLPSGGKSIGSINGPGGTFDVTNFGTKSRRVVETAVSFQPVK